MAGEMGLIEVSHQDTVAAIEAGARDFLSLGITSAHEAGVSARDVRAFTEAMGPGRTRLRVYMML